MLTPLGSACQGPRCSIRSRKLYSDAIPDYGKMTLLNLPAAVLVRARPEWQWLSSAPSLRCTVRTACIRPGCASSVTHYALEDDARLDDMGWHSTAAEACPSCLRGCWRALPAGTAESPAHIHRCC